MRMLNGQAQQKPLRRRPDQVLRTHRHLKREFMSDPFLARSFNRFLAKILQLSAEDYRVYRKRRTGLFDGQELNRSGFRRVAFRLPSDAAQRKWRNWPQQAEGIVHRNMQVGRLAGMRLARGAMNLFGQELAG